jgi:hypothetical protein
MEDMVSVQSITIQRKKLKTVVTIESTIDKSQTISYAQRLERSHLLRR